MGSTEGDDVVLVEVAGFVVKFGTDALAAGLGDTVDRGVLGADVVACAGVENGGVGASGCADGGVNEDLGTVGTWGALNLSTLRKMFCKSNAGFSEVAPVGGGCCPWLWPSGDRNAGTVVVVSFTVTCHLSPFGPTPCRV